MRDSNRIARHSVRRVNAAAVVSFKQGADERIVKHEHCTYCP